MKRIILKKVLKQLNIKQSSEKNKNEKTVATTLNLNGKVVNCKINNISLNNYVQDLTNIELTAIIDNLIKEKIYVDDKDQFANQISANIAEEILKLISNNNCCINSICPDVYGLYNEGKYYDFIINSLFLEQNPPLITDIKIFNNPISIEAGSSYKIIAQIKPKNTINTNIKWKSSNTEIVDIEMCNPPYIINLSCIIKAKSIGKANITVSTEDDTIIDCCEINVITPDKDNKTVNVPSNIFNKNINNKKETVYKGLLCGVILLIALMLIYNYCTYNNKISKTNIFKIEDISPENTSLPLNQQQIF